MYMTANLAIPAFEPAPAPADQALDALFAGQSLTVDQAEALFAEVVAGRLPEPSIAALLIALRIKGETAEELIGAARALRAADANFPRPDYLFADSCGTGGDGSGTINLSTAVAFVAAAAGLPVAKHGNRSITSKCGSADVLEALGVKLDAPAAVSRRALDEVGVCFLFAPNYHPGLRHTGPVRRALRVRTVMNILGPCVNPAEPKVQLLGVAEARLIEPVALTLQALGVERALVVHGSGLDEVALHAPTEAARLADSRIERLTITPGEAGLGEASVEPLQGGSVAENAERLRALLMGYGTSAETRAVAINAGALFLAAGISGTIRHGTELALRTIGSGEPAKRLKRLVAITNA
jgi:anthranilate phosphoribosyltransferase